MRKEKVVEKWAEILYTDLKDVFIAVTPLQEAEDYKRCVKLAKKLWEEVG